VTQEPSHEHAPGDDVAELIEWHTPNSPARPPSRKRQHSPRAEDLNPAASEADSADAEPS
jgi:hypothetical protein